MSGLANIEDNNSFTHIHNPLLLLMNRSMDGKEHACKSGHIDYASIAQFRQGDFVDETRHVKNAFYSCMLASWPV